jgi:hypothetical protein
MLKETYMQRTLNMNLVTITCHQLGCSTDTTSIEC